MYILLLLFFSCEKANKMEDPHYKELIGTWSTVSDTEKKTWILPILGVAFTLK